MHALNIAYKRIDNKIQSHATFIYVNNTCTSIGADKLIRQRAAELNTLHANYFNSFFLSLMQYWQTVYHLRGMRSSGPLCCCIVAWRTINLQQTSHENNATKYDHIDPLWPHCLLCTLCYLYKVSYQYFDWPQKWYRLLRFYELIGRNVLVVSNCLL